MKRALAVWVAFLILLSIGQVGAASAVRTGWCLIKTEYLVDDLDTDINGPCKSYMSNGALLLDYWQDTVADHSVVIDHYRTDEGGGVLARARWQVEWEKPAAFLPAGEHASITVKHIVLAVEPWTPPGVTVKIDVPDLEIDGASASPNTFHQPNGGFDGTVDTSAVVYDDCQVMTSQDPLPEGAEGSLIALYINFGEGYGMRYTYAWGAEAAQSADTGAQKAGQNGETAPTEAPGSGHSVLIWDGAATPTPSPASPFADASEAAKSEVLWTNQNIYAVENGAQAYYVIFELESDAVVTSIQTYHYLSGGAEPGELTLYAESGSQWGPFQATGTEGQGGVKNAYWIADTGELELPAGRYAVADSDPDTWSCNAESGYEGFLEVRGYVPGAASGGNPFASATAAPNSQSVSLEESLVGLWLSEPVEDGNQVILDIWPGGALELFYCYYTGSGEGSVEALLGGEWECLASAVCSYDLSADEMYLDTGYDDVSELFVELPDGDTLYLTDAYGNRMALHRASPVQEDAWRSWAWGTINPQDGGTGESYDGENATLPEDDQLDDWLTGLWLSGADADGNQTLIRVLPDYRIELYPCIHYGDYCGTLDELTDGNWDFIGPEVFEYYVAQDMLALYSDDGSAVIWAMNILDDDTILMEDEFTEMFLYERATSRQEADWLEWMEQYQF